MTKLFYSYAFTLGNGQQLYPPAWFAQQVCPSWHVDPSMHFTSLGGGLAATFVNQVMALSPCRHFSPVESHVKPFGQQWSLSSQQTAWFEIK